MATPSRRGNGFMEYHTRKTTKQAVGVTLHTGTTQMLGIFMRLNHRDIFSVNHGLGEPRAGANLYMVVIVRDM